MIETVPSQNSNLAKFRSQSNPLRPSAKGRSGRSPTPFPHQTPRNDVRSKQRGTRVVRGESAAAANVNGGVPVPLTCAPSFCSNITSRVGCGRGRRSEIKRKAEEREREKEQSVREREREREGAES